MQEIKHLINVMMDASKDLKKIYESAKYSKEKNHKEHFNYYYNIAMNRIAEVKEADKMLYETVNEYKAMHGTEMGEEDTYIWECLYGNYIDNIDNIEKDLKDLKMKG